MGFCQGAIGFQVADGAYGDVRLDRQRACVAVKWPGAIHEGNGIAAIYIDEGASQAQRDALLKIISGEAGGPPFAILAGTFSHVLGPYFVKITMKVAGKDTEVAVDGRIKFSFQPIRNPVTKAEAYPKAVVPQGFIFQEADQYALKEFWVSEGPTLSFAHPGKCAELAKVRWQGP
jgi:hypothetical protein